MSRENIFYKNFQIKDKRRILYPSQHPRADGTGCWEAAGLEPSLPLVPLLSASLKIHVLSQVIPSRINGKKNFNDSKI